MPTPESGRRYRRGPLRITVPSRNDRFLRSLVEVVGGPLGRRTEPGMISPGFWRVERVLLVLVFVFGLLAVLTKDVCRQSGWGIQPAYTGLCYSDWTALYGARGFADDAWAPFATGASDRFHYPVLMSLIASLTSLLVPKGIGSGSQLLAYFDINAFLVVVLWAVVVIAVAKSSGRRVWDAALVAASPAIMLAATVNWDMWAVAFLALGLLALGREHPWLAGILIGLAASTLLYPVLVLGALLVLSIRTGVWSPLLKVAGAAAATWAVVNVPFVLADPMRWVGFYSSDVTRGAGNSSVWQVWNLSVGRAVPEWTVGTEVITIVGTIVFAAACLGILAVGLLAPQPPRVASLVFLALAAFVLVGKVYSPQDVLWLVPLAALAYPRWRTLLSWQLIEMLHFVGVWMFLYMYSGDKNANGRFPEWLFCLLVLAHVVAVMWIMALVVRSIMVPSTDPVRRVGLDDPLGGLWAGHDAFAPRATATEPAVGPAPETGLVPVSAAGAGAPKHFASTPVPIAPSTPGQAPLDSSD